MKGCAKASSVHVATPAMTRNIFGQKPGFARSCGRSRWPAQIALLASLLVLAQPALARPWQHHREAAGARAGRMGAAQRRSFAREPQRAPQRRLHVYPRQNPAGEHLPQWFQHHQNMSIQQQERALRRQPGFNRLTPGQRRRVINRLRYLDAQPPGVRARIMARNEAFERLSPERKQEVRAAAQAFQRMPQYRKEQLGRAFHVLRTLPPDQRAAILHSARFQSEYSPRERHILSNLLSIEPWQPVRPPPPPPSPPRH